MHVWSLKVGDLLTPTSVVNQVLTFFCLLVKLIGPKWNYY